MTQFENGKVSWRFLKKELPLCKDFQIKHTNDKIVNEKNNIRFQLALI